MLYGDAETFVLLVAVAVDETADDGHGFLGAFPEGGAVHQMSDEDGGKDVACAVEGEGDFLVGEEES